MLEILRLCGAVLLQVLSQYPYFDRNCKLTINHLLLGLLKKMDLVPVIFVITDTLFWFLSIHRISISYSSDNLPGMFVSNKCVHMPVRVIRRVVGIRDLNEVRFRHHLTSFKLFLIGFHI